MSGASKIAGLAAFDLTGQTALITGAAGLLGGQHAAALAAIGAHVVLSDIDPAAVQAVADRLGSQYAGQIFACTLDVTDEASVRDALARIGRVDILINNAALDPKMTADGAGTEFSRLENFPLAGWERELAVGLTGAFLCSRVFGTEMAKRRHGVILNIASDLSLIAPDQRLYREERLEDDQQPVKPVTYSVIKSGLVGLTRYLAGYWAGQNIRVNALSPGGVYNHQPDDFVSRLTQLIPMGRMANLNEYQAAIQFLCSAASSYMTGQNIVLDGGRTIF